MGGQAVVQWGYDSRDGSEVVIKVISLEDQYAELCFKREISSIQHVQSPYFVRYLDYYTAGLKAYIVLEPVRGGNLQEFLLNKGAVNEATALRWLYQLTKGLKHLWRNGFIHRDLKPENVMLTADNPSADVKLIDTGIARLVDRLTTLTPVGTSKYMAPEVTTGGHSKFEVDIWGLGTLLFELVKGLTHNDEKFIEIAGSLPNISVQGESLVEILLAGMLKLEPQQRLHPAELRFLLKYQLKGLSGPLQYCKDCISRTQITMRAGTFPENCPALEEIRPDRCLSMSGLTLMVYTCAGTSLHSLLSSGPLFYDAVAGVASQLLDLISRLHAENHILPLLGIEAVHIQNQGGNLLVKVISIPVFSSSRQEKSADYGNLARICLYMLTKTPAALQESSYSATLNAYSAELTEDCSSFLALLPTGNCPLSHPFLAPRPPLQLHEAQFPPDLCRALALAELLAHQNSVKLAYLLLGLVYYACCALQTTATDEASDAIKLFLVRCNAEMERRARWLETRQGEKVKGTPAYICEELLLHCKSNPQAAEAVEVTKLLCRAKRWLVEAQVVFPSAQRLYSSLSRPR